MLTAVTPFALWEDDTQPCTGDLSFRDVDKNCSIGRSCSPLSNSSHPSPMYTLSAWSVRCLLLIGWEATKHMVTAQLCAWGVRCPLLIGWEATKHMVTAQLCAWGVRCLLLIGWEATKHMVTAQLCAWGIRCPLLIGWEATKW
jgi:hypothetical protein